MSLFKKLTGRTFSEIIGRDISGTVKRVHVETCDGKNALVTRPCIPAGQGTGIPSIDGSKLIIEEMDASTGGIARGTSVDDTDGQVKIYEYTGTGLVFGFLVNLDGGSNWRIRFIVDSNEIFIGASPGFEVNDLNSGAVFNFDSAGDREEAMMGMETNDNLVHFRGPLMYPIAFGTKVEIFVSRVSATSPKDFRAGLITLQKDT